MILNIRIYKEDNQVKIRFDSIIPEDESPSVQINPRDIYNIMRLEKIVANKIILKNEMKIEELDIIFFSTCYQENIKEFTQESFICTLPTHPSIAFSFFVQIEGFFCDLITDMKQITTILFDGKSIEENLVVDRTNMEIKKLAMTMEEYCNLAIKDNQSVLTRFLAEILKQCADDGKYLETIKVINLLYKVEDNKIPVAIQKKIELTLLFDINRHLIRGPDLCLKLQESDIEKNKLYVALKEGSLQYTVITPLGETIINQISLDQLDSRLREPLTKSQFPYLSKILQITSERGHTLTKMECSQTLQSMLNKLIHLQKWRLFAPFIGKESADGANYTWDYSEWYFLRSAQFILRSDGLVSIINLQQNEGYREYYAKGRLFEGCLEADLRRINLPLKEGCNCNEEITFDVDCSEQLKAMGLHLNLNYLKSFLYLRNIWKFFNHSQPKSDLFEKMPIELSEIILSEACAITPQNMDENDRALARVMGMS